MKLGEQIKQIRKNKGIKQKELAEQLGISANAMCNIEKGYSCPSGMTIERICAILNVELKLIEMTTGKEYQEFVSLVKRMRKAQERQEFTDSTLDREAIYACRKLTKQRESEVEEYKAWTSLPFYEDLFHQMMCDVHNVALELKDEKQKNTLMVVANKLAILCDRCNENFRMKIEF